MPSYFDLLKYARTGLESPDMTAFDKLKALALCGGGLSPYTIIGQPPLSFKSDGTPLTSVTIKGNGVQNGTPSPQNIVPFDGTGERTGNLFDKYSDTINDNWLPRPGVDVPTGTYSISNGTDRAVYYRIGNDGVTVQINANRTVENINATDRLYVLRDNNVRQDGVMLNSGSIALPYEPYGYKIPLTCAGQTVPIYLGQVQTVRRVQKLVLTGKETSWAEGSKSLFILNLPDVLNGSGITSCMCSHYNAVPNIEGGYSSLSDGCCSVRYNMQKIWFRDLSAGGLENFKSYLAQQYAAGTPVTVWYVLSTPETGIVNEPLCKIGDYADELHSEDAGVTIPTVKGQNTLTVDTELQPSEMTITVRI